jgi:type IV secretory pathway ATPase VirB11/archaellum biosynthesis ATPase
LDRFVKATAKIAQLHITRYLPVIDCNHPGEYEIRVALSGLIAKGVARNLWRMAQLLEQAIHGNISVDAKRP